MARGRAIDPAERDQAAAEIADAKRQEIEARAAETRAALEANGEYVSPTRTGSVEPPLMDEDPDQVARLEDEAEVESDEEHDEQVWAKVAEAFMPKPQGLHAKLAEVMGIAGRIPKNGTAPAAMGGYKFVQVGDAADPIRKALAERGITMMPHAIETVSLVYEGGKNKNMNLHTIQMTWRLTDSETGEFYDLPSLGTGGDTGDKFSPKAQTNAMKYALLMGFLLSTGDDPEAADLSEPTSGPPITITGSDIKGVRQGGRQSEVSSAQLDAIRRGAREADLTPEALTLLIGATLGGHAPDLTGLESINDQQSAVLAFIGGLSFDDAASVVRAVNDIPTAYEQAIAPEDVGAK